MIEIQETVELLAWAIKTKWKINEEIVEDGGGLPDFATLAEPHRFAAGFDPDSTSETNRLWVRMKAGGTEFWGADASTMDRFSAVCSAERLDGE